MSQLKASKTIGELEPNDSLFYIDPKKPTEIDHLVIKSIRPWEQKKGYMVIEYYKSSAATVILHPDALEDLQTGKIIAESKAKSFMSASVPPTVYFTNKKAIEEFMGIKQKS